MKYCFKILMFTSIICGLLSCNKFLDTKPESFLTQPEYYNDSAKILKALAGVYQPLTSSSIYGDCWFDQFAASSSDESFYARSAVSNLYYFLYDYTDNNIGALWSQCYVGINRANMLLANINNAKGKMSQQSMNYVLGQNYFLRGYYYYLLASNFGGVPLKLTPSVTVATVNAPRASLADTYKQVLADMMLGDSLCNTADRIGTGSMVSKTVVEGMVARVCLTMAGYPLKDQSKYAMALDYATRVVISGVHSLNPSYSNMFINLHQKKYDVKESMWEVEFNTNANDGIQDFTRNANTNGIPWNTNNGDPGYSYGFVATTDTLFNAFEAGDLRRDWCIAPYSYSTTPTATTPFSYNYFTGSQVFNRFDGKFRREYEITPSASKNKNNTVVNWPVLRYADVLLMQAEAENEVNGPTSVSYNAINQVRRRAFGVTTTKPDATVSVVKGITITNAGSGYLTNVPNVPVTISGGNGTGATAAATINSSKVVSGIGLLNFGTGYTSVPTLAVGAQWAAGISYALNAQVAAPNGKLYTVTTAGTSTTTPPTNTSGASSAATTGAVFTYAGVAATATATVTTTTVDLPQGLSKDQMRAAIQQERFKELSFEGLRKGDLIRWGIWVQTMNATGARIKANGGSSFAYGGTPGLNVTSKHLLFPIPVTEMTTNKAMTQNPGW
jgi:hypothetical protein